MAKGFSLEAVLGCTLPSGGRVCRKPSENSKSQSPDTAPGVIQCVPVEGES